MAELVDAPDSKSGFRKKVQVRFLFRARQNNKTLQVVAGLCYFANAMGFKQQKSKAIHQEYT